MNQLRAQSVPLDTLRPGESTMALPSAPARSNSSGGEQALFHVDLLRSLQLHRRLVLGIALVFAALAVAYFLYLWPIYLAQSQVYIQPQTPKVLDQGGAARWPYDYSTYESYMSQQMLNVTRSDVLANAIQKLPPGIFEPGSENDQAAIERFRRTIEVLRVPGSYQFNIGVRAKNPEVAAQMANAVTASYIESASKEQKAGDAQRLAILKEERDRVQNELTADRTEQEALNKQLGVAAVNTGAPDHFDEDITKTREELIRARTEHDEAAARFNAMNAGQGSSSAAIDAEADQLIAADPGLSSMKTSLNTQRAQLSMEMTKLTPSHPLYKQDAAQLVKIDNELNSMMSDLRAKAADGIQQHLRVDLERTAGVESQLNGQLRQLVGEAGGATPKMQRSSDLAADITRLQARFSNVDEQMHNLILEDGAPGSAFQTTAAVPPLHPAKSGAIRNAVLLVFFGLFLGAFVAVVVHKMDPKVYIAADVEHVLGFAPMAQLPDFNEVSDGVAEEQLLRLSAALEYARKQGNLKTCIFTGTGAGTGVTTVVTRVRNMLEAMGRPTVMVDASGGTPHPSPRATAAPTYASNDISTQMGTRSTALLKRVADETVQKESLVLTDTAPLTVSAETEYLARFVDCAIIVAESGVTTRAQLREVADTLQRLDVAAVGFVLNRVGMRMADPAYRRSVQAIEKHLNAQGGSTARRAMRNLPYSPEPESVTPAAPSSRETATRSFDPPELSRPESAAALPAAAPITAPPIAAPQRIAAPPVATPQIPASQIPAPRTASPQIAAPQIAASAVAAPAIPAAPPISAPVAPIAAQPARPAAFAPAAQRAAAVSPPREAVKPASRPEQDLPWWLTDSAAETIAVPAPAPATVRRLTWNQTPEAPGRPVPVPPAALPSTPPRQAWERDSGRLENFNPAEPIVSAPRPGSDEPQYQGATRLSGLRNLLFSLGLKNVESGSGSSAQAETSAIPAMPVERQIYAPTYTPPAAPNPIPIVPAATYETEVSAAAARAQRPPVTTLPPREFQAEILPPKLADDITGKPHSRQTEQTDRFDRDDSYDDLQILPSRRGQYRRK